MENSNGSNFPTTIEELAVMIHTHMASKDDIKNVASKEDIKDMATKDDIKELKEKLKELRDGTQEGFKEVFRRLNRVEEVLLENHNNRILQLEQDVKELKGLLKV